MGVKMSTIVSNAYLSSYTPSGQLAERSQQSNVDKGVETPTYAPAINLTLSEAAQAALAGEEQGTSTDATLTKLQDFLERLGLSSPLDGDKLVVDLSSFSREEIFTISSNSGNMFTEEEQKAAQIELDERFDNALSGGHAVMRVTGNYADLYGNALEYLEGAGSDEKETASWQAQYHALKQAETYLDQNPDIAPNGIANDPVVDYLERVAKGEVSINGNIDVVAAEARTVLDSIDNTKGNMEGLTDFGSRTLSAIALNVSDQFSNREVAAAKHEVKSRLGADVQSALQQSSLSGDPTDFSKRLISQYSSMSVEEREAAGLDESYYDTIVKNYETSLQISQTYTTGTTGGGVMSLLNYL
jgi:hypothetical protein